jgi:RimJ/RimL family protein N-acetyltransferase
MTDVLNEFGQPIGAPVENWTARALPSREPMQGRFCRLVALELSHAADLYDAYATDADDRHWTYLPYGPYKSATAYEKALQVLLGLDGTLFYAIVDEASARPVGVAAYLRIDAAMGCIEVGHLRYSRALQRTPAATEAMVLMMRRVFDELGYRRYEWKCDSRNAPSLAAARRLGFQFEGIFRQAMVIKGRNRDTAWLSVLDTEWPVLKAAFDGWLNPLNFDSEGRQKRPLAAVRADLQADLRLARGGSAS